MIRDIIFGVFIIVLICALIWMVAELVKESNRYRAESRERRKAIFWECIGKEQGLNWCLRIINEDL